METDIEPATLTTSPSRTRRWQVLWRIALVLAALAVSNFSAWAALPLTALAVMVTAEWAVRRRQRGVVDAVVTAAACVLATAVLLGLALNVLPIGLTHRSWSLGGGIVALLVLALGAIRPIPASVWHQLALHRDGQRISRKPVGPGAWVNGICALAAVLIVAGALAFSANSAIAASTTPLEMAAITAGSQIQVTINAGSSQGPFDLLMVTNFKPVPVATDLNVTETDSLVVLVTVPPTGRTLLQLVPAGGTDPLRELIFDSGNLTSVPTQ